MWKILVNSVVKYRFMVLTFLLVAVCGVWLNGQTDSTQVVVTLKPDFSTPQKMMETVGGYLGALITILVGYIPFVRRWASSTKGFKALKIASAAIPVLVVVFTFGFKGDVLQIVLTTIWSIVGGLGGYALFVRPFKEITEPSDIRV